MPASNQRVIMGERYFKSKTELKKDMAVTWANKERSRGFKARLEKVARGNYTVWTTRKFANL